MSSKPDQNISDLWVQHQRKHTKTTQNWACILCEDRRIFATDTALWEHAKFEHAERLESRKNDLEAFKEEYTTESAQKRCVAPKADNRIGPQKTTALSAHLTDSNTSPIL